ncbi:MAG TPA: Gfo/Idh/MocA family oxidoreductase [Gaiellales bacterium]|nr:Gfo/Idh/MocA family oxidoreductase [Gaiellales bacterium]
MSEPVRVGQVGLGGWGRNLLRNFSALPGCDLRWACDADPETRERHAAAHPGTRFSGRFDDLLEDPEVEAVVIATPVPSHFELARQAIEAGKHVMVEKPMTWRAAEARELRDLVEASGRVLMVGHLLRFHPGVEKLRELIDSGELGDVRYVYGNRLNLGVIRKDENALWSLGVHDLSVILHLLDGDPVEVWARGEGYVRESVEDVVFAYLKFSSGQIGHLHLSWLDPHKMRKMTVVGSARMAVFDDMEPERKVTVYDKGPVIGGDGTISTHTGDIQVPRIPLVEPLRLECEHFLHAVRSGERPRADVEDGLRVVEVLEAMQHSLERGGETVRLAVAR